MSYISPFKLRLAADYIFHGGIIAYPTEAVYGLGCNPLDERAVLRLLALKQRPIEKGLILIASRMQQVEPFIQIDSKIRSKVAKTWPGPVTWVFPAQHWVPKWLTGKHNTIAVRISAHPIVIKLCDKLAVALISTSANPNGKSPAVKALGVRKYFPHDNIHILKGDVGHLAQTTPIFDAISDHSYR